MVRQAFRTAVSGSPGPVHLEFRGNEGQIDLEEAEMDAEVETLFAAVPPFRPEPNAESIAKALAILQAAEKPVIVAGGGARWSMAGPAIVRLAEKLQIPVATSHGGKDAIPATHPLSVGVVGTYSRGSANRVVSEADLVFFIGTETGGMTTHFWKVPKLGTRSIQIDIDPEALGRNYRLEAAVQGDAKVSLDKMIALADAGTAAKRKAWVEQARRHVGAWYQQYNELLTSDAVPIRPERICAELSKNLPDDAFVVCDTGHAGMWMGGMYDLRTPQQSYIRCAGHLGWAFPASLGAKCAVPNRPVVCFTGDGGLWYHVGELETAVRWNIPAVIVVNDNHSGNQSKHGYDVIYGGKQTEQARELWVFKDINFAALAEVVGALGIRVTKASEIAPAIEKGIASGRPTVIDIATDLDAEAPFAVV
jgi:acetolactate synthase-1/2/3 large subunit